MRYTRMRKYREKGWKLKVVIKVVAIWYALIFSVIHFSGTNAAFNDVERESFSLETGEWVWDRSSLSFDGVESGFCSKDFKGFYSGIKNVGDRDMAGTTTFWLSYVESGAGPNKNNPGEKVYEGVVPIIKSNESVVLKVTFTEPPLPGKYKFVAMQRPFHGIPNSLKGNQSVEEDRLIIWGNQEINIDKNDIDACWNQGITDTTNSSIGDDEEKVSGTEVQEENKANQNSEETIDNQTKEVETDDEAKEKGVQEEELKNTDKTIDGVQEEVEEAVEQDMKDDDNSETNENEENI